MSFEGENFTNACYEQLKLVINLIFRTLQVGK